MDQKCSNMNIWLKQKKNPQNLELHLKEIIYVEMTTVCIKCQLFEYFTKIKAILDLIKNMFII